MSKQNYQCPYCEKEYDEEWILKSHITKYHKDESEKEEITEKETNEKASKTNEKSNSQEEFIAACGHNTINGKCPYGCPNGTKKYFL